jgi:DNA-binding Xre family transcriptional regulator
LRRCAHVAADFFLAVAVGTSMTATMKLLSSPTAAATPLPLTLKDRLARTLRRHRLRRRWSLNDAALALGMPVETYQKLEEAQVNATLQTLERMCERLKIDVRALFEL